MEAGAGRGEGDPNVSFSRNTPKHDCCLSLLIDGHVNSFVDLFYLSHRLTDPVLGPGGEVVTPAKQVEMPDSELEFLRDNLTRAEAATRVGDAQAIFDSHRSTADAFADQKNHKLAVYFYEKCLQVAKHSLDKDSEGEAHAELAKCYEAMDDLPSAIEHHERTLRLAKRSRNAGGETLAQKRLFSVYERFAAKCEARREWGDAVRYHMSCMNIAEGSRDDRLRGQVHMRLAVALRNQGDLSAAAGHAEAYLDLCVKAKDNDGACTACHFLAGAYKGMGKMENAVEFLERLLELSQQAEQRLVQSEACSELGTIYNVRGEYANALGYYEESFDLARTVSDQQRIALSRVQLGIAKGNASMDEFTNMVTNPNPLEFFQWRLERATK